MGACLLEQSLEMQDEAGTHDELYLSVNDTFSDRILLL